MRLENDLLKVICYSSLQPAYRCEFDSGLISNSRWQPSVPGEMVHFDAKSEFSWESNCMEIMEQFDRQLEIAMAKIALNFKRQSTNRRALQTHSEPHYYVSLSLSVM